MIHSIDLILTYLPAVPGEQEQGGEVDEEKFSNGGEEIKGLEGLECSCRTSTVGGDVALLGPLWNNDWKLAQISFFRTVIEQLKYFTIVVDSFPVSRCCVLAPAMGGH